jgi:hypothetical protein
MAGDERIGLGLGLKGGEEGAQLGDDVHHRGSWAERVGGKRDIETGGIRAVLVISSPVYAGRAHF